MAMPSLIRNGSWGGRWWLPRSWMGATRCCIGARCMRAACRLRRRRSGWGWFRKHHAWKVTEPDVFLYGEEIYGVHSIEYDPVPEDRTFYAFALRFEDGSFGSFREMAEYATSRSIPVVPVLFEGTFDSVRQVRDFVSEAHGQPSALGGEREGVVLRVAGGFPAADFERSVCKSVRVGHVQSDEHWSKRWRPCRIARR